MMRTWAGGLKASASKVPSKGGPLDRPVTSSRSASSMMASQSTEAGTSRVAFAMASRRTHRGRLHMTRSEAEGNQRALIPQRLGV